MDITLSLIKADVGSIGGHTKPSERMLQAVRDAVAGAFEAELLIDGFVAHTGDDIAILMSHRLGEGADEVHQFAWNTLPEGDRHRPRVWPLRRRAGPPGRRALGQRPRRRPGGGRDRFQPQPGHTPSGREFHGVGSDQVDEFA